MEAIRPVRQFGHFVDEGIQTFRTAERLRFLFRGGSPGGSDGFVDHGLLLEIVERIASGFMSRPGGGFLAGFRVFFSPAIRSCC
jgi:hypothetical protein